MWEQKLRMPTSPVNIPLPNLNKGLMFTVNRRTGQARMTNRKKVVTHSKKKRGPRFVYQLESLKFNLFPPELTLTSAYLQV